MTTDAPLTVSKVSTSWSYATRGSARAVRCAPLRGVRRLIGFIDGDGQYGPDALGAMSHLCDAGGDLVVGQRFDPCPRCSASQRCLRMMLGLVHLLVDPTLSEPRPESR
jgi:hypothetical protein